MRILQVNKFFHIKGGSEVYLFSLSDALKELGHDVAEFSMEDEKNEYSLWSKYFVSNIDYDTDQLIKKIDHGLSIIYSREAKNKISKLLDHFKPDIVHLHIFQHQLTASILPEIKKRNIPIVYTAHDLKSVCPNYKMLSHGNVCEKCFGHKYYQCTFNRCTKNSFIKSFINTVEMYFHHFRGYYNLIDTIITPSDFYRRKLLEARFQKEKVIHLPNFVDENKYKPKYNSQNYFIYFGRLSEEKGLVTLIRAMKLVKKSSLSIIGSGPLRDTLEEMVVFNKLDNVKFLGFKKGKELETLIRDSMFSILPSEWYENGPLSLIESFAYGKPVIGANIGGIPEHISHGSDGLIFESKNHFDLAEKINFFIDNPYDTQKMGENARRKVKNKYSQKEHVKKVEQIYENLIG